MICWPLARPVGGAAKLVQDRPSHCSKLAVTPWPPTAIQAIPPRHETEVAAGCPFSPTDHWEPGPKRVRVTRGGDNATATHSPRWTQETEFNGGSEEEPPEGSEVVAVELVAVEFRGADAGCP